MIKLEVELDFTEDEILDGIRNNFNAAVSNTVKLAEARAHQLASQKLRSGLKFWEKGFAIDKITDGTWVITMTGKLANMMEEGFGRGEIKDMILNGNRARYNKGQGKDYVDVPIHLDADSMTGQIGKTKVTVQKFKDADEVIKSVTLSDWAKGGVKKEKRITQRVEDVIKSRKVKDSETASQYMVIRRVSEKSQGWPVSPFRGAKVFEALDLYLERAFEESLNQLL
jgi:hypothetical protein